MRLNAHSVVLALLFSLALGCPSASADGVCQLTRVAALPLTASPGGSMTVPMTVAGRTMNLAVDTAGISTLRADIVDNSRLPIQESRYRITFHDPRLNFVDMMKQIDTASTNRFIVIENAELGTLKAPKLAFFPAPASWLRTFYGDADGVLGADTLKNFDVEFDFANSVIYLYLQNHCPGQVIYWTKEPAARIAFGTDDLDRIAIPIELDGKALGATIATGMLETTGSFDAAASDFGFDSGNASLVKELDSDGRTEVYRYPFKALSFEGVTVRNPKIVLIPTKLHRISNGPDTIHLGLDTLRRFHLFVSYAEHALYLTSATAH